MTSIVRKFNAKFDQKRVAGMQQGHEVEADTLRRELEEIERDTERYVAQAQRLIERERMREGER